MQAFQRRKLAGVDVFLATALQQLRAMAGNSADESLAAEFMQAPVPAAAIVAAPPAAATIRVPAPAFAPAPTPAPIPAPIPVSVAVTKPADLFDAASFAAPSATSAHTPSTSSASELFLALADLGPAPKHVEGSTSGQRSPGVQDEHDEASSAVAAADQTAAAEEVISTNDADAADADANTDADGAAEEGESATLADGGLLA